MDIEDVAEELYGLAPEEFTAARNARAKEARSAGDSELAAAVQRLRKPTTGAWLLNQLVRQHGDELQQVLDLGAQLRAAQGTLAADELRALDRQRRQLTHAVAQQARAIGREAGRKVTDQVTTAVEESLRSAMVDAAAGAALSSGLLTDTFSSTGIEPVDLSGVTALAGAPAPEAPASSPSAGRDEDDRPDPAHERRVVAAEKAAAEAVSALEVAHDAVVQARDELAAATQERERLETEREEARRRLSDLDEQVTAAAEAQDATTRAGDEAEQGEAAAAEEAERLRKELGALREARSAL